MTKITTKKKAYKFGLVAEKIAAVFLTMKGYRVIARRYHNPKGEIDILATKGKTLAIVEVKARQSLESGAYSIPLWKQQKILGALEWLMASSGKIATLAKAGERVIRFDAIIIVPGRLPVHLKDAWRI